jgi:hypothetical protein
LVGYFEELVGLGDHSLHGAVLDFEVEGQLVVGAEFSQVDARLDQAFALKEEEI